MILDRFSGAPALFSFVFAAFAGWAFTYFAKWVALRFSVLAVPCERRKHESPTPLLGGLAIYLVLAAGVSTLLYFGHRFHIPVSSRNALLFLGALTLIFITGAVDDWAELNAPKKFLGQTIAAIMVLVAEDRLPALFQNYGIPFWLGYPLALVWIVGITNSMNLIDGLDGLCSGVAAISATGLFMLLAPLSVASITVSVLAGAAVGFLIHNFHPARIFLGDSGSLLLGFALASLTLKVDFTGPLPLPLAAAVPVLLFGLPILDTVLAIARRLVNSRPIFDGDRSHLHHRLRHLGMSPRASSILLLSYQAYSVILAVSLHLSLPQSHWAILALGVPPLLFALKGLGFIEHLISFQSARLSAFYLEDELKRTSDRGRMISFVAEQMARYQMEKTPFTVVVMDCSDYLRQIVNENPSRLVTFYIQLFGTLRARLRSTDLIARPSELLFAIVLPETAADDPNAAPVFDYLSTELKRLQTVYGIFQSVRTIPEGYRVYSYPRDKARIFKALRLAGPSRQKEKAA